MPYPSQCTKVTIFELTDRTKWYFQVLLQHGIHPLEELLDDKWFDICVGLGSIWKYVGPIPVVTMTIRPEARKGNNMTASLQMLQTAFKDCLPKRILKNQKTLIYVQGKVFKPNLEIKSYSVVARDFTEIYMDLKNIYFKTQERFYSSNLGNIT